MPKGRRRPVESILADIEDAAAAAHEIVARGRSTWDEDRLLRLAAEAVVGRIADAANRLPEDVKAAISDVSWDDLRDLRIVVDHIYHRIDYEALWITLESDVPDLVRRVRGWKERGET